MAHLDKAARHWKVPALSDLLRYRNPEVIARFVKDYGVDRRTARVVFDDLLRFLWLSVWAQEKSKPKTEIAMFEAMAVVDEMWHVFLTFSRDYLEFSHRYFGSYLHHNPAKLLGGAHHANAEESKRKSDATVELTWRQLGPRIARRWFHEYAQKYPMPTIRRLQLTAAKANRAA